VEAGRVVGWSPTVWVGGALLASQQWHPE
jgi:hypothetical protein